eukprot:95682-Ditylum_brightwellii.AAC.1
MGGVLGGKLPITAAMASIKLLYCVSPASTRLMHAKSFVVHSLFSSGIKKTLCSSFGLHSLSLIHCVASVSFTQPLSDAAMSNIISSLQLQALTRQLKNKNAKFVHVSTVFVHVSTAFVHGSST